MNREESAPGYRTIRLLLRRQHRCRRNFRRKHGSVAAAGTARPPGYLNGVHQILHVLPQHRKKGARMSATASSAVGHRPIVTRSVGGQVGYELYGKQLATAVSLTLKAFRHLVTRFWSLFVSETS